MLAVEPGYVRADGDGLGVVVPPRVYVAVAKGAVVVAESFDEETRRVEHRVFREECLGIDAAGGASAEVDGVADGECLKHVVEVDVIERYHHAAQRVGCGLSVDGESLAGASGSEVADVYAVGTDIDACRSDMPGRVIEYEVGGHEAYACQEAVVIARKGCREAQVAVEILGAVYAPADGCEQRVGDARRVEVEVHRSIFVGTMV